MVLKNSHVKIWLVCDCRKEYNVAVNAIKDNKPRCKCCKSTAVKLCKDDACDKCYNKSFKAHPKSLYWDIHLNSLQPRQVALHSNTPIHFICSQGHKFMLTPNAIITANTWCQLCKVTTEMLLNNKLMSLGYEISPQATYDWCKNSETGYFLRFDVVVESVKCIVELDGAQHFRQVANWDPPEKQHINDLFKMKCAKEQGYTMIRIFQEDVWNNRGNWLEKLQAALHVYEIPSEIYISTGNHYDIFKNRQK
jgi:Protein of unknown function (DUF559)